MYYQTLFQRNSYNEHKYVMELFEVYFVPQSTRSPARYEIEFHVVYFL